MRFHYSRFGFELGAGLEWLGLWGLAALPWVGGMEFYLGVTYHYLFTYSVLYQLPPDMELSGASWRHVIGVGFTTPLLTWGYTRSIRNRERVAYSQHCPIRWAPFKPT